MVIGPTSANGLIGNLETDVPISGLSDLTVRTLVSRYFSQRKAYLQGTADTISAAVEPMVTDEAAHKDALAEANAVLTGSTIAIDTVAIGDYMASVEATETVTFVIDGTIVQETVAHKIRVYIKNDGSLIVGSDGYTVTTIGFVSASYVSPEAAELANIIPEGSSACIVSVAQREYGVAPNDDGTTKYGIWFEAVCDTGTNDEKYDYTAEPWCSMFVSWCAYQANVPEYLIPYTAWCPDWADFYKNEGRYYHSACGGGSYTPQPGDLIFIGVNGADDTFDSPGHVGIVTLVGSGVVYYMEGNAEYYNSDDVAVRQVWASSMSLTSTDILAYGSPYYNLDSHSFAYWEYDDTMHWSTCMACDTERIYPHDLFEYGAGFACYGCEYTSN